MSRYGSLRERVGHSQWFLQQTLVEHDATMDHPAMKAVYDQSIKDTQYLKWLSGQFHIFDSMERIIKHRGSGGMAALLDPFLDPRLDRSSAAEQDCIELYGETWRNREDAQVSPKTAEYLSMLRADTEREDAPIYLLCHHFLQVVESHLRNPSNPSPIHNPTHNFSTTQFSLVASI